MKSQSCLVATSATHSHVGKHQEDSACNVVYMTLLNGKRYENPCQLYSVVVHGINSYKAIYAANLVEITGLEPVTS